MAWNVVTEPYLAEEEGSRQEGAGLLLSRCLLDGTNCCREVLMTLI